jgi:oligo-1,6-glucosidase
VSHYGDDGEYRERSAKLLATLELTLRGTPFIYQGQEIGMTNFDFTGFAELNDIETLNLNRLLKRFHVPRFLRWRWLKESSRDNARTPVQWSAAPGAGFTTGRPWLGINGNHTQINYESQRDKGDSVLGYYKRLISLRASSETLKYGGFKPLYAKNAVIAYERALGDERYWVILNFSRKTARNPLAELPGAPVNSNVVISNTGRADPEGKLNPWEALVVR